MTNIRDKLVDHRYSQRFLEVAQEFRTIDTEWSEAIAETFLCEPKVCYENCQENAATFSDLLYLDDFVTFGHVDLEHSWLVNEDGDVLDPTLVLIPSNLTKVEGYIGVEIPTEYLERCIKEDSWRDGRIEQNH
jgi:hypothetical protein